jgi:transcriptional regulator with XRE-family HTH domain
MDSQALGRYLRETREAKELTLEDAERALKIRRRILESFELGEFTLSDASLVQVRGFIRNYARYLALDEDRIVTYFENARQEATHPRRPGSSRKRTTTTVPIAAPVAPRKITDTPPAMPPVKISTPEQAARRSNILNTLVLLLVALASIAVIGFVIFQLVGTPPIQRLDSEEPGLDLAQLPPTPTPPTIVPTITFAVFASSTPIIQQDYPGRGVMVTVLAQQRGWMRVSTDGRQQLAQLVLPGTTLEFVASQEILLTVSNAAALLVVWNGQQQPPFGGRGQQVDVTFTSTNVAIQYGEGFEPTSAFTATPLPSLVAAVTSTSTPGPSPTPTLTPSITPTFTASPTWTASPTITLTPSITPTPSDTPTATLTPTITLTPSPTAILPPRVTQPSLEPSKTVVP